jgi:glyoxylase-like metal-dependent hydrolase (beta-lactamase superfamily II)
MKNPEGFISFGNLKIVTGRRNGRTPFCNSIYIDDEIKGIIDPHSSREFCEKIAPVTEIVINSHFHIDHTGYNFLFEKSRIFAPSKEKEIYHSFERLIEEYGVQNASFVPAWKEFYFKKKRFFDFTPSQFFDDGDVFDFGKTRLKVISAPGHTPGHSFFLFENEGLIFSVDVDLTDFGPWYGGKSSDINQFINSIRKLEEFKDFYLLTGHEAGLIKNFLPLLKRFEDKIYEREKIILNFLQKPQNPKSLTGKKIIYPDDGNEWFRIAEENMIRAHLKKLLEEGRIEEVEKELFVARCQGV